MSENKDGIKAEIKGGNKDEIDAVKIITALLCLKDVIIEKEIKKTKKEYIKIKKKLNEGKK